MADQILDFSLLSLGHLRSGPGEHRGCFRLRIFAAATVRSEGGIVVGMSEDAIQMPYPAFSRTRFRGTVRRRMLLWAAGAACLASGLALGGCGKALFPETEPRTQFDRYDRSRDEYAPTYIEDEFGRRQPNLTGRLSPKR